MKSWVKIVLVVMTVSVLCIAQEFPDAPMPQPKVEEKQPKFFTFARRDANKPLRTNRQTLKSPGFIVPQVLQYMAVGISIARTRHSSTAPRGGELYADALVPAVIISAMSYGSDRLLWRPLGVGLAGFVIFRHSRAAATGRYP
jgi:hypothetical protein